MQRFLRNPQQERWEFQLRLKTLWGLIITLCVLLLARLVWLQVISHGYYHTLAEANRISIVPIVPNRGLILDRKGTVLAENNYTYDLEINPARNKNLDRLIDQLSELVTITSSDRKLFRKALDETHGLSPVPIRNRLSETEIARFAVNHYQFPGVDIQARLIRDYPLGTSASHLIGYIGRINEADQERLDDAGLTDEYRGTNHIGKLGIEGHYEHELHGVTGSEQVETDASGRGVRSLSRIDPTAGDDLFLTVDAGLQQAAEKAFGDHRGALVAIEPGTGDILAFVSEPGFDPNLFVEGIDQDNWNALNNSPDKPLNNRALRGLYPPGSTVKPFMALAALTLGKRTTAYKISDPGYFSFPGSSHRYRDWRQGGHGMVDMHLSIVQSCDTYYYGLANDLGIDAMHDFFSEFGFGQKTGIDIDGEMSGLYPSTEWKKKRYKQDWYGGETVISGIGQGYILTTPLQLAQAVATLANNGVMMKPHLVHAIRDRATGSVREIAPENERTLPLKQSDIDFVRDAMEDVMKPGGTAAQAGAGAPYLIAGKTGTAQVVGVRQGEKYNEGRTAERNRDHALFIAFAPADKPRIAVAVLVENGGHGGSTAAPIARKVFDYYLLGRGVTPVPDNSDAGDDSAHD
ncbi:MAG: penicillin-binding protein 2 [Betaproteobacteria bacterium]|nr:penicillin-binding protein 2 [Betaproteobacteria bacterium]MDE2211259.1 penicillin-binding protein 2 [Betaproteobacteria bacterium]